MPSANHYAFLSPDMKGEWNRPSINIEPELHRVADNYAREEKGQSFAAYVRMLIKADLKKAGIWPVKKVGPENSR